MATMTIKLKHLYPVTSRGRKYWYVRVPGKKSVRLKEKHGTPAFRIEYDAIIEQIKSSDSGKYAKGTLGHLIEIYRASEWFTLKRAATRKGYERTLGQLENYATLRLASLTRSRIISMRNDRLRQLYGEWGANYCVTVLGVMFAFAREQGLMEHDPLKEEIRKLVVPEAKRRENRPWTDRERVAVMAAASDALWIALALAMATGLRKSDMLRATLSTIKDGEFSILTAKRDRWVRIPLHPILGEAMARRAKILAGKRGPDPAQIAITSAGRPWTIGGFDSSWLKLRARLEASAKVAPGLRVHGLRHTLGHMLHEAGASDRDIHDVLGNNMARHYSKGARMSPEAKARVLGLPLLKR